MGFSSDDLNMIIVWCYTFLGDLWHEPSVCCLSVVYLWWRCCALLTGLKFSAIFLQQLTA